MLHYRQPATEWNEALPLGNGRLGCMVHGRTTTELFQLNEDSVWYGGPQKRTPPDALRHLARLRQLIRDGQQAEAEDLVRLAFFSTPASMRHYEPLGNLCIELGHEAAGVENYRRQLDLQAARHTVSYRYKGVWHRRETVASYPGQVLAMRITSEQPMRMIFRLNRVSDVEWETNEYLDSIHAEDSRIILHATPGGRDANRLCIVLGVRCTDADAGGNVEAVGNCLVVTSTSCVVAIGAHTTFRHADPQHAAQGDVDAALDTPWDELCRRQLDDYQQLFGRITLHMTPDAADVPTDERLRTGRDAGLAALYHNYGRYLLIASSRNDGPQALPATLQGIWNPSFAPAWGSKYTININLQMNGWPAAPCNLVECMLPVVGLLERMAVRGRETASAMYGCRGWCAHHNTDIWADTAPQDRWMPATLWPLGGAWLVADAMDLLTFSYDRALHKRLASLLDGCVAFLLDYLVVSADGCHLVTSPSLSPENTFVTADGSRGILCEGSTIDTTIVRMVFDKYLWSQAILGGDNGDNNSQVAQVRTALGKPGTDGPRLQDMTVNAAGRIQEWGVHDYDEHEPGHRHISHLFGLYPASYIDRTKTPALCDAARRVLERRAAHGGGHTGWSRAWLLNLHARLADGEGCSEHMDHLLNTSTLPNLLDSHPPFQIDGNFGACAGVIECLVQSVILTPEDRTEDNITGTYTQITLLPACPRSWKSGRLAGVRVRGGWDVSMTWEAGQVTGTVRLGKTQDTPLPFVVCFPSGESYRASDDSSVHEIAAM